MQIRLAHSKNRLFLFIFPLLVGCTTLTTTPNVETTSPIVNTPVLVEQDKNVHMYTGIHEIDSIIQILLSGNQETIRQHIQFIELACTKADGLGGLPKCQDEEVEGTLVSVFPILAQSGYYVRSNNVEQIHQP